MGLFSALIIGGAVCGFLTRLFSKILKGDPSLKNDSNFQQYSKYLRSRLEIPNHYLIYPERQEMVKKLMEEATSSLQIDCTKYQEQTLSILDELNNHFIDKEAQENSAFFDNIMGHSLDKQQREAILRDEARHLIVAGAGAGKTLTIVGKVAYLCVKKKISPKEILLISFTNKAAEEMSDRLTKHLGYPIAAYTFHKLGLEIIRKHSSAAPNISDDNLLEGIINQYYEQAFSSVVNVANKLLTFLAYYLYIPVDKRKFRTLGEYIEAERGTDLETLKSKYEKRKGLPEKLSISGERMKSQEEVMIANFLFLNGVKYEYERPYPYTTKFSYLPDFYLPDYDIYLEHFGIDKEGQCPWLSNIEAQKYIQAMEQKRQTHKQYKTKLIETYSYYQSDGVLLDKLKDLLLTNGVTLSPIAKKEVLKEIFMREDRGLKEFNRLLSSFIHLFKAQGYTSKDFPQLEAKFPESNYLKERCKLFFSIAGAISEKYDSALGSKRSIDFSDMIAKATNIINNSTEPLPYKYIIIDEYQDIGADRYRLVKALLNATHAKLICIGDDWQSIYRFNGSDVGLFTAFERYWGQGYISRIEKTYRNSQQLIDICGNFIMRNPAQIKKKLISDKVAIDPIRRVYYERGNQQTGLEQILDDIFEKFGESTVFLLGRNNCDINFIDQSELSNLTVMKISSEIKVKYYKHPKLKISFLTAHRAKGLEADNVIIINCKNDYLGFPNKVADDPILQILLSTEDSYRYAEERRLMYVALTRTKNFTYLLVPKQDFSEFIMELNSMGVVDMPCEKIEPEASAEDKTLSCPKCKTGKLCKREGKEGVFYGCSNYPQCDYTCKNPSQYICTRCGGIMVSRKNRKDGSRFYGCSNYPLCTNTLNSDSKKNTYRRYQKRSYSRKRYY